MDNNRFSINNIRKEFLNFYKEKGHMTEASFSLIPKNDKSLLLIGAGMAPMKRYFTGDDVPPSKRMATCQKCVRTGDIENVGLTARHLTFFEMLGSFSFGDYFKEEAIVWAWEFLTEVLKIDKEKLWVTVYLEDEEAEKIWHEKVGLPLDRIVRLGKEDNFWELEVGPSGPCSEIYYDTGADKCENPDCKPGCDCKKYVEIWNLVFTQFDKDENGVYHPLKNPNIDTGLGLDRVSMVLQGAKTVFDIEPMIFIINKISEISGIEYGIDQKSDTDMKIICDHSRAATFLISDGVIPSNEGRGYVLRKLIRRAILRAKFLNIKNSFLTEVVDVVIDKWKHAYPNLDEKRDYILKVISIEEKKFKITIDVGLEILTKTIDGLRKLNKFVLDGAVAFKMYDTYGFPSELIEEILAERNLKLDKASFIKIMQEHREMAQKSREKTGGSGWKGQSIVVDTDKTIFTGYEELDRESKILSIVKDEKEVSKVLENEKALIILDKTPFYPEGGGQIGDTGTICSSESNAEVIGTKKYANDIIVHEVIVRKGNISVGDVVKALVNETNRANTAKNHTCTHILHKVLKDVLGNHINQAGSYVTPDRLRFDYTHFENIEVEKLKEIEKLVNEAIVKDYKVYIDILSLEDAKKRGAVALFDEKYKEKVRVVSIDNFSKELCGGTHVTDTAKIGIFKIISEGSISSGIRRIEAVTGSGALNYLNDLNNLVEELCITMKSTKEELLVKVNNLKKETKEKEKEIQKLNNDILKSSMDDLLNNYKEINNIKSFIIEFTDKDTNYLREIADRIKDKNESCVIFLASDMGDKVLFVASVTKDLVQKGIHAGNLVKEASKVAGGGGGGRPDFAQAGGKDPKKIQDAINVIESLLMNI